MTADWRVQCQPVAVDHRATSIGEDADGRLAFQTAYPVHPQSGDLRVPRMAAEVRSRAAGRPRGKSALARRLTDMMGRCQIA